LAEHEGFSIFDLTKILAMAEALYLSKPAPAWFYAILEWIHTLNFRRKRPDEVNYFLID
jgi:hypothetical protein